MKVEEVKHVEDCFDGSLIKELLLSSEISKKLIFALGEDGKVQYFPHFAKPFFKIRVVGKYDLKGIEGNKTMRIHLKYPKKYSTNEFIKFLEMVH